jgi:hypothetical protein
MCADCHFLLSDEYRPEFILARTDYWCALDRDIDMGVGHGVVPESCPLREKDVHIVLKDDV